MPATSPGKTQSRQEGSPVHIDGINLEDASVGDLGSGGTTTSAEKRKKRLSPVKKKPPKSSVSKNSEKEEENEDSFSANCLVPSCIDGGSSMCSFRSTTQTRFEEALREREIAESEFRKCQAKLRRSNQKVHEVATEYLKRTSCTRRLSSTGGVEDAEEPEVCLWLMAFLRLFFLYSYSPGRSVNHVNTHVFHQNNRIVLKTCNKGGMEGRLAVHHRRNRPVRGGLSTLFRVPTEHHLAFSGITHIAHCFCRKS